jgi:DNA-binding NarL/FixJ family response regulator
MNAEQLRASSDNPDSSNGVKYLIWRSHWFFAIPILYTPDPAATVVTFNNTIPDGSDMNINLSARELEILAQIKLGKTNKDIAKELNIAVGTVKLHVNSIFRKLGVSNRVQAVCVSDEISLRDNVN